MGWIVYSKDGQTEKCVLHKLEYSGTFMGDRTVIATFSSEKKIDFSVFDYITYRGERFELELLPTVKKVSSYEYKYELRFVSLKYELERCMMRNIVPGDNGIVYPTPLSVEFTGDVKYLAERIQACLDAMYGKGAWSITIAESTESEEKNISMSNQNCWDALSLVNTEYKLNYFIKGRNVIIGGEEPVVDNVFEYGKGKGLYEIERISDTDTGVVTKLRAYGGTRNLDYSYPKLPDWKDSVLPANYALSPLRLMLPSFKADGKTDYVLASEEAIAKYGIREGTITYDDIYPSITGMKNSSGQAIDEIKSVSAITNETQPTFTVGLYDLGFDLNESLTTDEAQMSMKSGSLQGYTFNITKIERASDGSYTLTLGRNTLEKEDTGNFTVPNKDWNMKAGDKFVLLNILMPQAYIRDAENRLLARAKEYLAKYSSTNYSYNVGVDEIFMARNVNFYNDIMEGKRLTVNDQEIGINNENIIIQSLTIKEGEGIIPTFEVTLNNETTASTLDRIQGQISEVETSVSNNFSSQSELLKQYRKKLDKSVWDSIFVIHKDDSENPEKITSVQSLVGLWTNEFLSAKGLNPGSGGGSGEGGATALYQLNDVAKNASETGVLGAGPGKVLTYGNDGKWYAADAVGLDETALGKYLTDNNYAKKSDIPSLSGYATQSWVLGKNYITSDALSGYATQSWVNSQGYATASSLKDVSDKLNDFLEGSDTDGIINKWKELEAFLAGQTQTSTLADLLAVKADKATTLSGYGITDAYTKTEVNTKLGSYVTTTALNTALAKKVDVAFLAKVFGFIGEDSSEVSINDMGSVITSIKAKFGLWTEQYLSSKGLNPNAGSGEGSDYNRLDAWDDYSTDKSGYVLSAGLGWDLNTRVSSLESKAITLTTSGTGNGLSGFTQNGNTVTFSKATFLTEHQSLAGYATESWVNNKGYLVATSADKANWNTAFGWGDHSKAGYATQLWVTSKDYATIADLDARINALVNGAPEAFDTLKEIADVLQGNVNQIEDLLTAIGTKADKTITISAGTGLNGGGTLAANRTINLSAATTKALGGIIVGDRLSIDSDGKLSATYTYTLPTASASVLGGVKVGTTLAISSGVLNLKAVGTAGTYFKTTTDAYGRVTAGSNPTTLAGFGITDGVNDVAYSGSGNAVTSATVSGHIITLVKGTTFLTKATFDDLFEKVNIGTASAPVYAIKAKYGLYTEQFLSSMGLNLGTGSGGGSDYDRLDTWADYDASKAGWVLSAGLGNDLNTRVKSLEGGSALTVTTTGSGNAVTSVAKSGTLITVTKGTTFVDLASAQTITGQKTFSSSILMGRSNLHYVNHASTTNATGLYWKTANYAATQFGIGCFTTNNASPRGFIGWTSEPWQTANNLTVSETSLTYKGNAILHSANYNTYAPTKTGGGASGSWGISITGNAATANTATKLGTATIGAANKPIYLNAGTPTALSSTVGDSTVPAYLNAGTVTVCSWGLAGASGKRARKSGYITSSTASLSSYWGKIASFNWGDTSNDRDITLYIHSAFNSLWGTVVIRTRWSSATSTVIDFRIINGNIPTSRLRLYYDVSAKDNVITLWGDVNAQWGAFNTYVLSETTRTSSETGDVTLYTTSFTTAQTLPTSTYKTPTYLSILNNADTATTLRTSRTIFGKSFNGSANVAGQALVYGTYQETASSRYSKGGLQIRENGMVGSAQTDDGYAPAIGFHWANRIGASLILTTSGFKFMNQAFTGYQNVYGIFKGNADSATQVYNTETNPTSGTWYNGTFVTSSTNGNKAIRSNDGFKYYTLEGTASAQGEAMLQLGTPTATGTAGNKRGRLVLYSSSSGYGIFVMTTTTGAYTFTFPAATGTVALTSSNVASATKLQTARTLWGQSFNGTANVSGSMTGVGPSIVATANLSITTTGENNNLSLKYNNDDTKSVVLNTSAFKPFDLATNKLNLGTSAARWLGLYANTGNFSSTVTGTRFISTVATGTAPLTVSSTTVVTNLNADMVDGIHSSNIPLEYDANYIPSGTAARWLRIAYFDYTGASYSWSGTFTITNSYSNNENTGIIFNVTTRHTTTSANVTPNITQVSGNSNIFTSIRLVKDTSTTYANVYLEVYYNSTSAGNRVYVSYKPANRSIGKWSLYSTYTAGSVPDNHTVIAQVTTTDGFATNQNIRAQGYLYVAGNATFNNRLIIQSDGKIVPYSTATRRSGVYGVYDAAKIGHIWSMGSAYQIADDGSTFGSLYGFAYKHTTNTTGGTMASGHQAVWCENGVPKVAIGSNLWVANNATISAVLYTDTLTIKNTEAVAHLKFSRGSYNYITAPASGNITFVVGGQAVGSATAELTIQNGSLIPGATNATSLGSSSLRWSNTYTQLLNVAGVATLSSTVNIAGVLNANNATDATSTTAAGAVFDGGVGIAKQLRVGGVVTLSSGLSAQYTGSSWITLATRGNIIYGSQNQTEASAHGLYRVKSFAGDAVVFGGLGNAIGFYGFYKARIDAGTNGSDWATTWNTTTGTLTHNKAMTVSGATTLNSTLTVASTGLFNLSTDATSTTAAAVRIVGGLAVGKQLRVGGAVTLSSTLAVTSTSTFTGKTTHNGGIGATTGTFSSTLSAAGVVSFTNATDATSTTAAAVKITGGLGIAKQLRVGGASTFSGTINTSVATFINLGANATDQKILKDVDGNGFYSGISFFGTKGSNMGVSDIMMNIYAGGAIQIHSQAGSGQILLNGTVHNNVGMYSDGYMSSKGLNDTSDMRLKNKGRDIFLSVKDMAHAPAFEYTWKDGTPGVMAGSSAQYWQKVLPPSVKIKKDGYMTMFYGHTALVATISLARHVETLEERVERLERENKEKDKRIKELERRISAWE